MQQIIHLNVTQDVTHGTTIIFVCAILVMVASFIDMWTGIDAARVNKEPISSKSLRKTIAKIVDYLRVLLFAVLIDVLGLFFPWYAIPYFSIICTLGILLIEGRSVIENSKKKKANAGEVAEMVEKIINCAVSKDAEELIQLIKDSNKKGEKK